MLSLLFFLTTPPSFFILIAKDTGRRLVVPTALPSFSIKVDSILLESLCIYDSIRDFRSETRLKG